MGSIHQILHAHLGYRKVCAQWVAKHLTDEQNNLLMGICMEVLCQYQTDGEGFLEQIVTGDETWCHHFDPAMKRMSQEWRYPGSPRPRKARSSATAGKVMLTVFIDIHGPLLLEWMPVSATINTERYYDALQNLRRAIKNKRPGKLSQGVLMFHDNARPDAAHATRDTLRRFGWGVLDHPSYSSDLSQCDLSRVWAIEEDSEGQAFARQWNSGSSSNPYRLQRV
jgi:histone-lysine N-methyltransferase SETMAR